MYLGGGYPPPLGGVDFVIFSVFLGFFRFFWVFTTFRAQMGFLSGFLLKSGWIRPVFGSI